MRDFKIKIYADGADMDTMRGMNTLGYVAGFTTNPSLCRKAGIRDYMAFCRKIVTEFKDKPISLEVINDTKEKMELEAKKLASLGSNIYVKIPIVNYMGESSYEIIGRLSASGVQVNVTAVFTIEQAKNAMDALSDATPSIISIFAGRIADTGRNASNIVRNAVGLCSERKNIEILWASCREVYNIVEAEESGAHIITVTEDIMRRLNLLDKDLNEFSRETALMFHNDALACGLSVHG